MKILVTGGAGFIGSHVCEYYSKKGAQVIAFDNMIRAKLLGKAKANTSYNWNYLKTLKNVKRIHGSVIDMNALKSAMKNVHAVVHTAGQTAVTTSVIKPALDFQINAAGTFNVLEAARQIKKSPMVVLCSTNKVYGENVNQVPIREQKTRYIFSGKYSRGIPENFGVDLCEHTPYGCSKLTADIYAQDYARLYGLKVGVFRMSCIYGTRQFGVEDQGWLAWFIIAAVTGKPLTIFGTGKQVRDVLWVGDLVRAYDAFIQSKHSHGVFNMGGGSENTLSLIELLGLLKEQNLIPKIKFSKWRPSDQKVYVSDIRKAGKLLKWTPEINPGMGVVQLTDWVQKHKNLF